MAKYNYDKSILKGLGVGAFLGEVKLREKHIEQADSTMPQSIFNSNILAKKLHPKFQNVIVSKIEDLGSTKKITLSANKEKGTEKLAYFRAGQYISMLIDDGNKRTMRPYTICSSPKDALAENSTYTILVKKVEGGFVTNHIFNNWKEGTELVISAPLGHYFYTDLRDAKHVVALAGGSGITPFASMAGAIAQGIEDFNLTIIYGSRVSNDILYKEQLDEFEKQSNGKVKVVHVLSDEEKDGYEHGFITVDIIKKYADVDDYSVFVCGPPAMYKFLFAEIAKLELPNRRVRYEVPGENLDASLLPELKDVEDNTKRKVKVHIKGEVFEVEIDAKTNILRGLEDAGILIQSDCRSGKCSWCRSRLISGDVYIPTDDRRAADAKFGWIHPCCSYAKSDIELEVFPMM